ncbi:MAG: hypothetical protein M1826_003035 [Phylliscum demangeonii]|nr:MAG: hypothetical protein M1826_003035 [Phylliscum demangeonii]
MEALEKFTIKVPSSSANIGPGFDAIGLALALYLELHVTVDRSPSTEPAAADASQASDPSAGQAASASASASSPRPPSLNCTLTYSGRGGDGVGVALDASQNLITRTAAYVLGCHARPAQDHHDHHDDQAAAGGAGRAFPHPTRIAIANAIPLGRGLGSSGAAVVAGVVLANEVGQLALTKARMLDFCLMIERHPDNVAAALYGGFVGSFLLQPLPVEAGDAAADAAGTIPASEAVPEPGSATTTGRTIPPPPLAHSLRLPLSAGIRRALVVIPTSFRLPTATARSILPPTYARADAVFNASRLALLVPALGAPVPDPALVYAAMQDRLHQPYRAALVPGLDRILRLLTPARFPGLLGACLSGAGPTVLVLALDEAPFVEMADAVTAVWVECGVACEALVLDVDRDGARVERDERDEREERDGA